MLEDPDRRRALVAWETGDDSPLEVADAALAVVLDATEEMEA